MSVKFISGKPGGGKTLYSVSLIIEELRRSRRVIVTNVSLDVGKTCEYLQREFGDTFGARWRILKIEPEQVAEFWRWFAPDAPPLEKKCKLKLPGGKLVERLSYEERIKRTPIEEGTDSVTALWWWQEMQALRTACGVVYVLDEVHEFFNARKWADTGDEALHYLSQHRKLGDDVICITQSIGNVDKQFRSVAQDFTYLRNHGKESMPLLGGIVRGARIFSRETYLEPFTGSQRSFESRVFRLDVKGIASCYDTAAGVGIQGAGADTSDRRKGLPPWVPLIAILGIGFGIWYIPDMVAGVAVDTKTAQIALNGMAPPAAVPGPSPVGVVQERKVPVPVPVVPVTNAAPAVPKKAQVWLTGIVARDGKVRAYLSDGRCVGPADGLEAVGSGRVRLRGEELRFKTASAVLD